MSKGDKQTNRSLGEATIALYHGRKPDWLPPVPITDLGVLSPNHYDEGVSVALAADLPGAVPQAIQRLEWQRDRGHCQRARTSEFLSDSHAAIEYRAQAQGLKAAARIGGKVLQLYKQWWAREIYACSRLFVPTGPRVGSIVGLGGRYQDAWDDTRDVCQALIAGRDPDKSKDYFKRAENVQDLIASLIVRDLVADGVFNDIEPEPPMLPFAYVVERYQGGHVTYTTQGGLQPGDPSICWVRYEDGAVGTKELVPEMGAQLFRTVMGTNP